MPASLTEADAAELYDITNPWDVARWAADRFYSELVMAASDVIDVGCGTGAMLHHARDAGHRGRLLGIDPDRSALDRARRRTDIEWVVGRAADIACHEEFDLAVMASHAFQCFVTDDEVRDSLAAIHTALRGGGRFAFETRHPQARAWDSWATSEPDLVMFGERRLYVAHHIVAVVDDLVTFDEIIRDEAGDTLRVDNGRLRFLDVTTLGEFLTAAGFVVDEQFGDWQRGPIDGASTEIITVGRRPS